MNHRVLAIAVAVLAAGGALWWYLHGSGPEEPEAKPSARVTLVPLQVGAIAQTLDCLLYTSPSPRD